MIEELRDAAESKRQSGYFVEGDLLDRAADELAALNKEIESFNNLAMRQTAIEESVEQLSRSSTISKLARWAGRVWARP